MIVSQAEIDLIQDPKTHRRELHLPVRHGRHGERKRCPMHVGGVYHLKPPIPYDQYRARAEQQLGRARSVLWLIGRCERHYSRPLTITVSDVQRHGDTWTVRFLKGDHAEYFRGPVFLARHNDFTMVPSQQTVRGDPEYLAPLAEDLARARGKALEKRLEPNRSDLAAIRAAHKRMAERKHTMKVATRRRLALIERETAKLDAELSVDGGGTLGPSDCAESESPADVEGERPSNGTGSFVPLESAA